MNTENKLVITHPNARHTGSKMEMQLIPAHDGREGCIHIHMENQSGAMEFDEDNYGYTYLTFTDVAQLVQVFHGECESINEGKGIYHYYERVNGKTPVVFRMRHIIEPMQGYHIEMSDGDRRFSIVLSPAEALGICCVLRQSFYRMVFG